MLGNIKENVPLKEYSTFKIGGNAKYFCEARNEEEVCRALDFAIENKLAVFVLGRGSNLLISDKGFNGLVMKMENREVRIGETENGYEAAAESGEYLAKLILDFQKEGISGLEWGAGIPATVGGAICNNAGAYGKDVGQSIKSVRVIEMKKDEKNSYLAGYEMKKINKSDCGFSYRKSIFKEKKDFLILEGVFSLGEGNPEEMRKSIEETIKNRASKQPLEYPNIGSIFKNPEISPSDAQRIFADNPEAREKFRPGTVPAGWLIEQTGLSGKSVGGAMVSEKHSNFIINTGGATAEDVVILISLIKQKVRVKFDVQLSEEIEYVGF